MGWVYEPDVCSAGAAARRNTLDPERAPPQPQLLGNDPVGQTQHSKTHALCHAVCFYVMISMI